MSKRGYNSDSSSIDEGNSTSSAPTHLPDEASVTDLIGPPPPLPPTPTPAPRRAPQTRLETRSPKPGLDKEKYTTLCSAWWAVRDLKAHQRAKHICRRTTFSQIEKRQVSQIVTRWNQDIQVFNSACKSLGLAPFQEDPPASSPPPSRKSSVDTTPTTTTTGTHQPPPQRPPQLLRPAGISGCSPAREPTPTIPSITRYLPTSTSKDSLAMNDVPSEVNGVSTEHAGKFCI